MGGWDHYFAPPPPLPPPLAEELGPQPWVAVPIPGQKESFASPNEAQTNGGENASLAAAAGGGTTTLIPPRIVHNLGTMALAYQGHHPDVNFGSANRPSNGLGGRVELNGSPLVTGAFPPLESPQRIMMGFQGVMETRGFKLEWGRADDNVSAAALLGSQYGGSNQFNRANIGLLVGHGVFGTTPDFTTTGAGVLDTYFPIYKTGVNSYDWVRFTQFQFGNSGSNLRWMGILSCNNMFPDNYDDMWNKEMLPIGDNLHLLLGASSTVYLVSNFGREYASALTGANGVQRQSIQEAWFYAGTKSQGFQTKSPKQTVTFRVAGWPNCFSDDLLSYQSPDSGNPGDIASVEREVFVP